MQTKRFTVPLQVKGIDDDGRFSGYGSVFETVDSYNEAVAPGAFERSLAERPASKVKMLWQHNTYEPIGVYESMVEDEHGLRVAGRILPSVQRGREAIELMKAGAIDGLSIGFVPKKYEDVENTGVRRVLEVDLWEVSIVTFPANQDALIELQKSICAGETPTPKTLERALRQCGFSKRQAKAVTAAGYKGLLSGDDADAHAIESDLAQTMLDLSGQIRRLSGQA